MKIKYVMAVCAALCLGGLVAAEPDNTEDDMKANIVFTLTGGREIVFAVAENQSSRDFVSQLPVTLEFEDYAGIEKVTDPPSPLSTAGAPRGHDPEIGDLCLYAPWGNLAVFYRDFGYARGLVKLGETVSGAEFLGEIEGQVRIRLAE